jgi:hypothetical protein
MESARRAAAPQLGQALLSPPAALRWNRSNRSPQAH